MPSKIGEHTTPILANYDGYLTTEKAERKTYDGTQAHNMMPSSELQRSILV